MFVHHMRAPLDFVIIPTTVNVPTCSEPSRTRPYGGANAPSLTAPARAGLSSIRVGRGEETGYQVKQRN